MVTEKARHGARQDRTKVKVVALEAEIKIKHLEQWLALNKCFSSTTIIIFIRKRQTSSHENGKMSVKMK